MSVTIRRVVITIGTYRTRGGIRKIPAIGVIDIAICIVIDPIPCDFTRVGPDIVAKFRMSLVYSGIKHSDSKGMQPPADPPRTNDIYVDSGVGVKCPLIGEACIIWDFSHVQAEVWLSCDDIL